MRRLQQFHHRHHGFFGETVDGSNRRSCSMSKIGIVSINLICEEGASKDRHSNRTCICLWTAPHHTRIAGFGIEETPGWRSSPCRSPSQTALALCWRPSDLAQTPAMRCIANYIDGKSNGKLRIIVWPFTLFAPLGSSSPYSKLPFIVLALSLGTRTMG